jgi:hypothetical protein
MGDKLSSSVELIIIEFDKLKDEIHQSERSLAQIFTTLLTSLTIISPILIFIFTNQIISNSLFVVIFALMTIIYSSLTYNFCYHVYTCYSIGSYIHEYIYPKINSINELKINSFKFFYWEEFIREKRKNLFVMFSSLSININVVIALMPSVLCLVLFNYFYKEMLKEGINDKLSYLIIDNYSQIYGFLLFIIILSVVILFSTYVIVLTHSFNSQKPKKVKE